jgi:hypothetical protein
MPRPFRSVGSALPEVSAGKLEVLLPLVNQAADMTALRRRELIASDDPASLRGVVVRDRRLESLPKGFGLTQLPPQPAQQADLGSTRYRLLTHFASLSSPTPSHSGCLPWERADFPRPGPRRQLASPAASKRACLTMHRNSNPRACTRNRRLDGRRMGDERQESDSMTLSVSAPICAPILQLLCAEAPIV